MRRVLLPCFLLASCAILNPPDGEPPAKFEDLLNESSGKLTWKATQLALGYSGSTQTPDDIATTVMVDCDHEIKQTAYYAYQAFRSRLPNGFESIRSDAQATDYHERMLRDYANTVRSLAIATVVKARTPAPAATASQPGR